jgi:DNA-binding NtrC family response regulator
MEKHRILVVDDDQTVREYVCELLERRGFEPEQANGGLDALSKVGVNTYDLVILDIKMPDMSGHEVLTKIKQTAPETVVIMVSAYASIPDAVHAIRDGAYDYLPKPFKERDFELLLNRALTLSDLLRENRELRAKHENIPEFVGKSPAMERIREIVDSVADSRITVLVTGPSGTGKEVVARLIHFRSQRASKPFVRINCAALPDTLLESELFGYEKGAFTGADKSRPGKFEAADGGTILLDEISETSPAFQAKLLRVIQEKEFSPIGSNEVKTVDIRIIATSNRNLPKLIEEGKFREDLYYRINVVPIHIPPLSERREDVPFLADYFLKKFSAENRKTITGFSREAMQILRQYSYRGNARELQNIIERAVVLCNGEEIEARDLAMDSSFSEPTSVKDELFADNLPLREIEKRAILYYLRKFGGNRSQVARIMDVSVRTIRNKLIDYQKRGIVVSPSGEVSYTTTYSNNSDQEN